PAAGDALVVDVGAGARLRGVPLPAPLSGLARLAARAHADHPGPRSPRRAARAAAGGGHRCRARSADARGRRVPTMSQRARRAQALGPGAWSLAKRIAPWALALVVLALIAHEA